MPRFRAPDIQIQIRKPYKKKQTSRKACKIHIGSSKVPEDLPKWGPEIQPNLKESEPGPPSVLSRTTRYPKTVP